MKGPVAGFATMQVTEATLCHPVDDPPYDEMWVDDRVWIPHLLAGETFRGEFVLSDDGASLRYYEMRVGVDMA